MEVQHLSWGLSPFLGTGCGADLGFLALCLQKGGSYGRIHSLVSPGMCPEQSGHGQVVEEAMEKWWRRPWKNGGEVQGLEMLGRSYSGNGVSVKIPP